jgi:hypothetical protein
MTRLNEYKAYFTVTGEFDPEEISQRLQMEPSDAWKKGDRNERTHLERKFSRWSLNSRLDAFQSIEEQIADVLAQLDGKEDSVRELKRLYFTGMVTVGWFYKDYPGMTFDRELIAALAKFNLGMDCDFYYLYSDRREDS